MLFLYALYLLPTVPTSLSLSMIDPLCILYHQREKAQRRAVAVNLLSIPFLRLPSALQTSSTNSQSVPMSCHSEASCWICLEEGKDNEGKSLVRDCACRGNTAGFAHMSCIIKYAMQKSEQATNYHEINTAWERCPNCNQN